VSSVAQATPSTRPAGRDAHPELGFQPARLLEVQLAAPLPDVAAVSPENGATYRRALVLVRLHAQVMGMVDVDLPENGIASRELAGLIWEQLAAPIRRHLQLDGVAIPARLDGSGISVAGVPRCEVERTALLADGPFVTVAIPTRDRPDTLARSLRSLLDLDYPRFDIVVVDNAPRTPATAELVAALAGARDTGSKRLHYAREDRPGISWAKNRGLREAAGEIVAFTDDDVVVDPHWLAALVGGFHAGPRVACVTGMILPMELETAPQGWIEEFGGFSKGLDRRIFDLQDHRPPGPLFPYTAGMFGSGASMAFDVATLRSLGGFDPALGAGGPSMGGEDLGICFETIRAGYQIVYEPSAILRHAHRRDYDGLRRQVYGYGVGLTAFLMKTLVDHPESVLDLARRLPAGVTYALSSRSGKNLKKRVDYPKELTRLELQGMTRGPLAYLKARRRVRHLSGVT
jgi:GT2 family glycosyltransferase